MGDYCFFTIEHPNARRVYIRGVADITEPIDDYKKIIKFGEYMSKELPSNPFKKECEEYKMFEELKSSIKSHFEEIGDELVFAKENNSEYAKYDNRISTDNYIIDMEKVIIW